MDFVKTCLETYLFKHDNKGHKNLTWGSLVDEQGSEETENPAEHPWNLAVSFVQPKTSSVPDKKSTIRVRSGFHVGKAAAASFTHWECSASILRPG